MAGVPGFPGAQGPSSSSQGPPPGFLTNVRNSLKKYGRTGIVVYLGLSTCVTAGFYVAIENHFDVKKFLNIKDEPDREPTFMERLVSTKGSSLALAILCSKAMVPIKLPVAAAITPYVHRLTLQFMRTTTPAVKTG